MKRLGRTLPFLVAALLTFQGLAAMAGPPVRISNDGVQAAPAVADRQALVREILDRWGNSPNPVVSENRTLYGDLQAALKLATVEQLLDARRGRTYDDVWASLPKGAMSVPSVIPLAVGQRISPLLVGPIAANLVYTPVTPCRIIDTRGGIAPYTGAIGPNTGNWFFVTGTNYSNQGGFAASCGIPTSPKPAAVAINVTSTQQSGTGNLRAIETGGGTPNASLVNYVAGVNIANAAIVRTYTGSGEELFIYSGNSTSQVVVDIMGYFSDLPTAGRAYAHVSPGASPTFISARTKGFSAVSQPAVGEYCLTPSDATVDPTTVPWFVTVDWSFSGGSDLLAFVRSTGFGCSAGQFDVMTFKFGASPASPVLSNSVSFEVFVP